MSELIDNSSFRKKKLKELILKLHHGENPKEVRKELLDTLQNIPYGEVVDVEQELIADGLPEQEILKLCDIHSEVLDGNIDLSSMKIVAPGHPIDTYLHENKALKEQIDIATSLFKQLVDKKEELSNIITPLKSCFNLLSDIEKHYLRKEYLLFPALERNNITGPPKVMWGKHDEIRESLKACHEVLRMPDLTREDLIDSLDLLFRPCLKALEDMITKEEQILFPMALDILTTEDWWNAYQQSMEIGYAIVEPEHEWKPEGFDHERESDENVGMSKGKISLPSGSFSVKELLAILNTLPVDMTFVDASDKVKYFSQGKHRIFTRSKSIINRDVQLCHPPSSVHIVEKIVEDFKSGKESHAPFWITMNGKFILIEYYALRDENGEYLGTLEVSQDLTNARSLEGEQRILSYQKQ